MFLLFKIIFSVPFRSVLFCSVLFCSVPFLSVSFRSVLFRSVPYGSVPVKKLSFPRNDVQPLIWASSYFFNSVPFLSFPGKNNRSL